MMTHKEITDQLIHWATEKSEVRAVLLTGSRANPHSKVDIFSDYDVVIIVKDSHLFYENKHWIEDFSEVLVTYWDPLEPLAGYNFEQVRNVIHYRNGLHIDFTIWSVEIMQEIVERGVLPADFDDGYIRLLDKDDITGQLSPPTFAVYVPTKPTEAVYLKVVEDFFSDVPYVAKCLWRDELLPAKWCLDFDMKHQFLLQMTEWWIEVQHDWSISTGVLGRGVRQHLPTSLWQKLEDTYVGANINDNWLALFATIDLFRQIAVDVGDALRYNYPHTMDKECVAYARMVQSTPASDSDSLT